MNEEKEIIINHTKRWIEGFIINHSICPFAKSPYESGKIKMHVLKEDSIEEWIEEGLKLCRQLSLEDPIKTSNAFLIFPGQLEVFLDFLDWQTLLEFNLQECGLDERIQIVGFHPQFQYRGEEFDDASNLTNRSPYPMIHILRVDEVAKAINEYGDTNRISERNIAYLRNLDKV